MNQFLQWVAMGGYSTYVWLAYGLVFGVLIINLISTKWQQKRVQKRLTKWFKNE